MKYVLILLGMLLMSEVVHGWGASVRVRIGKKRALAPELEDEEFVDARGVPLSPEVKQEVENDLVEKITDVVQKERKKFGI